MKLKSAGKHIQSSPSEISMDMTLFHTPYMEERACQSSKVAIKPRWKKGRPLPSKHLEVQEKDTLETM